MNESDRDRPTDPIGSQPPDAPDAATYHAMPPSAGLPGPDPNSFSEQAMQAILDGMAELKKARAAFDADALLSRQTEVFASIVTDRYEMIRGPLVEIHAKVSELFDRVGKHDTQIGDGAERIETLSLELAALRSQVAGIGQLYTRMDRLEHELAKLRAPASA